MDSKPIPSSKRVLLVDDDPLVVHLYERGLAQFGFKVTSAANGIAAMQALRDSIPDALVLDLMMPKLSGAEVLRFLRGRPETQSIPVIILSNAYMDPLAHDAARLGANRGLSKFACTPSLLASALNDLLEGRPFEASHDQLLAAPAERPSAPVPNPDTADTSPEVSKPIGPTTSPPAEKPDPREPARKQLAAHSPAVTRKLRESYQALLQTREERDRKLRLEVFYRQVHFITSVAGVAGYQPTAQMAAALEALLFGMMDRPVEISPSLDRTISMALEFLLEQLETPQEMNGDMATPNVLVVDDDKLCNRMVVTALRNAQMKAKGTEDPELALRWLHQENYNLVLLDVDMPGMDGLEFCKRLRAVPGYDKAPVIFVTLHCDFETRTKTLLSGGTDLISKPILPAELAVRAVMYFLREVQLPGR